MSLKKELTLFQLVVIGVVGAVGTGVLFSSAGMASVAGPALVLSWVVGAIFYTFVGLTYSELSVNYPEAGGPARYSLYSHGKLTNAIGAFANLLWYLFIPPIEALAVVEGLSFFFPQLLTSTGAPSLLGSAVGVLLILLFIPFNYFGVKFFGKTTSGLGLVKLAIYLALAFGTLAVVFRPQNFTAYGGFAPYGLAGMFSAIPIAMFAFGGIRVIPDYAEESKKSSMLGKAIMFTILGQSLIYVLFALVFVGGLDWKGLGINPGNWTAISTLPGNPFVDIASAEKASTLIPLALLVAILGPFVVGYIYLGGGTRVLLAMGRSDIVSDKMKQLHQTYSVPYWALIVFGIVGAIVTFLAAPVPTIYGDITDSVVAGYIAFALNPVSMQVLRNRGKIGYKLPGGALTAPLAFISSSLIAFWSGWPSVPYAILLIFIAVLIFSLKYKIIGNVRNSVWYIAYIAFITLITYIGSDGALSIIPFLTASLITAVASLGFFFWGVRSGLKETETVK
ncbi:APC family permease [Metallosphaera tengchongensis]|uniref:APC family permease n=1 Tax=Metallosphaera tengchongensis TaxID=1532350 RepID=A0A6N0NUX5_9CREN|nr:APC family permease [Metallosphaera tengchongensis]QKR00654.1 APC family permease [Metallosphaera tengchongensis]